MDVTNPYRHLEASHQHDKEDPEVLNALNISNMNFTFISQLPKIRCNQKTVHGSITHTTVGMKQGATCKIHY